MVSFNKIINDLEEQNKNIEINKQNNKEENVLKIQKIKKSYTLSEENFTNVINKLKKDNFKLTDAISDHEEKIKNSEINQKNMIYDYDACTKKIRNK